MTGSNGAVSLLYTPSTSTLWGPGTRSRFVCVLLSLLHPSHLKECEQLLHALERHVCRAKKIPWNYNDLHTITLALLGSRISRIYCPRYL